jgi:hypothetical protein
MSNLSIGILLLSLSVTSPNPLLEHYTIIPALGTIKSIASSPTSVFIISDNYLVIFNTQTMDIEKTLHFDEDIHLLAYDRLYNELWIAGTAHIIRFNTAMFNLREYPFTDDVDRIGIETDYVYLDGSRTYRLHKRSGVIELAPGIPSDVVWFQHTAGNDIRTYPYLAPYNYFDEPQFSEVPLRQYPITTLYDDGIHLYVGTAGYGLLQYNKVSWSKKRIVYGPLSARIHKVKKYDSTYYFLTAEGISYIDSDTRTWNYYRTAHTLVSMTYSSNKLMISSGHSISQDNNGVYVTVRTFNTDILTLNADAGQVYIGTTSGLYRMYHGTSEPLSFGPDKYSVYTVYPTAEYIFAGGEYSLYKYDRTDNTWTEALPFGVKDIACINDTLFLLGVSNQLIQYAYGADTFQSEHEQSWILLPYFNIYDIDADDEVLYCASYSGIYYYEPITQSYRVIYNLPRTDFTNVFIVGDTLYAVSKENLLTLPLRYRD